MYLYPSFTNTGIITKAELEAFRKRHGPILEPKDVARVILCGMGERRREIYLDIIIIVHPDPEVQLYTGAAGGGVAVCWCCRGCRLLVSAVCWCCGGLPSAGVRCLLVLWGLPSAGAARGGGVAVSWCLMSADAVGGCRPLSAGTVGGCC